MTTWFPPVTILCPLGARDDLRALPPQRFADSNGFLERYHDPPVRPNQKVDPRLFEKRQS